MTNKSNKYKMIRIIIILHKNLILIIILEKLISENLNNLNKKNK